jgi:bifunctional DNA-binding transcriptional regulator/antitoxin component of YhaV-PrlF toxin-antitoxin module
MAVVIPHEVVKQYEIDTSTVIIFRTDSAKKIIIMQMIQEKTCAINQDLISVVDADGSELPISNKH